MSIKQFQAILTSAEFPYNFKELASTVIIDRGFELNRNQARGEEAYKSAGICQAYHMNNVLPISRGYSSVRFAELVPAASGINGIRRSFVIYGESGRTALFVSDETTAYVYDPNGGNWQTVDIPGISVANVTYGTVRETTYIHLGNGIYRYNFTAKELELVELEGLASVGNTLGVVAAGPYLILWTNSQLFRSSATDAADFTPELGTGAGVESLQQLRGKIIMCASLGQDFIVYSEVNAVSGRATGNLAFPFTYKEVVNSAGVARYKHIALDSNSGAHIVWTKSGFQVVSASEAHYVYPELSDGLSRGLVVRQHEIFGLPSLYREPVVDVMLNFVSNRYFCVSTRVEGAEYYYDCYIFDSILQRWGKLTVPHAGFLQYTVPESYEDYTYGDLETEFITYGNIASRELIYRQLSAQVIESSNQIGKHLGLLLPEGAVYAVLWGELGEFEGVDGSEFGAVTPNILLGRYKAVRDEGMLFHWMKLANLHDANLRVYGHDYTGNVVRIKSDFVENSEHSGQYFGMLAADSFSVEVSGEFTLTQLVLATNSAGKVNQLAQNLTQDMTLLSLPLACSLESEVEEYWEPVEDPDYIVFDPEVPPDGAFVTSTLSSWMFLAPTNFDVEFDGILPTKCTLEITIPNTSLDFAGKFQVIDRYDHDVSTVVLGEADYTENPIPSGTSCLLVVIDLDPELMASNLIGAIKIDFDSYPYPEVWVHRILFDRPYLEPPPPGCSLTTEIQDYWEPEENYFVWNPSDFPLGGYQRVGFSNLSSLMGINFDPEFNGTPPTSVTLEVSLPATSMDFHGSITVVNALVGIPPDGIFELLGLIDLDSDPIVSGTTCRHIEIPLTEATEPTRFIITINQGIPYSEVVIHRILFDQPYIEEPVTFFTWDLSEDPGGSGTWGGISGTITLEIIDDTVEVNIIQGVFEQESINNIPWGSVIPDQFRPASLRGQAFLGFGLTIDPSVSFQISIDPAFAGSLVETYTYDLFD